MATITKKDLIDRIADTTGASTGEVKAIIQNFMDCITIELGKGNRVELRDFGVFEVRHRKKRTAQNPKTLEPVKVPAKRTAKFKLGHLMKEAVRNKAKM